MEFDVEKTYKVSEIRQETDKVKTFFFDFSKKAKPGQFIMLWIPGREEVPMSVSYSDGKRLAISAFAVGESTEKLHALQVGDLVGIRGPLGNPWKLSGKKIAVVAGGYGSAPLAFFAEELGNDIEISAFLGARTKDLLLFEERLKKACKKVICTTDDGSYGEKGLVTEPLEKLLQKKEFDTVYVCGPEGLEKSVFDLCEKYDIAMQASLERIFKCGLGICGACVAGKYRICTDGPVLDREQLRGIEDFGKFSRDKAGRKKKYGS
ncbi:MAG: dihydroorotate dehydrogenase electron transfer subunit [archaeon]|nr:dihydroorotate dehydrogenase electron transfer subunit [Candidatus Paceibacterota bacterium]MDP6704016.1 dihydroorotate dehydrogenase electron transfer subunit [archaeon]HIK01091.1 dihydroorotate dehydrogenase electron transfer subunit [Candidatus Undinarchaeales archaeon ERR594346 U_76725]|tara:strand:+ start:11820 stop:12611 length:792 start_codon:yes stop_codon:yes gene_type:complete